jgi:transposase InsO family protein
VKKGVRPMPRCPTKDYADRCKAVELKEEGVSGGQIAQALGRPARWVRRTLARYDSQVGRESLKDCSSRPHHCPNRTPSEVEEAICGLKRAHPVWGRRQIARQLRWQWRAEPERLCWVSEGRVRRVLARHPELGSPAPAREKRPPPRQIDYLECNLIWAADIQQTTLPDGSVWETLHWLDLHSRYELGQVTAPRLTEEMAARSFLQVATEHGLPLIVKTDRDKLFYDAPSGLPTLPARLMAAAVVYHLLIPKRQPWWNGGVERYIRTCREEACPPTEGVAQGMQRAMEDYRHFYNHERCHSRCNDQPPATLYHPSPRRLPPDLDLHQLPITLQPRVVTRRVQASGHLSLAGRTYPFSRRYAGQEVAITVDGWSATAQAQDGWQRTWDLHLAAEPSLADPLPPSPPQPLTRTVNRRGCVALNRCLYYVGIAWSGQRVTIERQGDVWLIPLPDGSTKTLPDKHLFPRPLRPRPPRPETPPAQPEANAFHTRRVTTAGQVAFHHRLYYVGTAHRGETVAVVPTSQGLAVYSAEHAWITTCPWRDQPQEDEPVCPT